MSAATTLPVGFLVTINWASGSDYQSTLLDVLKKAENPALYNDPSLGSDIHTPNDSTLTIGYGYNMSGNKAVVVAEFRSIGLFTTRPEAESILTRWAAGQATDTEVRDLNLVISEAQATSLLSYSITRAEAVVDSNFLIAQSQERIAFVSLALNSGQSLFGPNLRQAATSGNMGEVVWQLIARSGLQKVSWEDASGQHSQTGVRTNGLQNRRFEDVESLLVTLSSGSAENAALIGAALITHRDEFVALMAELRTTSAGAAPALANAAVQASQVAKFDQIIARVQTDLSYRGLHLVDKNQQFLIGLSAAIGESQAILSAINNGATTFSVGDSIRIPTGTVDLSIGQDTYSAEWRGWGACGDLFCRHGYRCQWRYGSSSGANGGERPG